jgi:uncharacterized protein (TIGR02611 family)
VKRVLGRIGRSVAGVLLVLVGIVLVPLPGPGFLVIFAGLVILARDYAWAQRLVDSARARAEQAGRSARRYLKPKKSSASETTSDPVTNGDRS